MLVLIKGAGDLATGIACRLLRSGFQVVMTEIPQPTAVRTAVAFSSAVFRGRVCIEDLEGELAADPQSALRIASAGRAAVLVDPACRCLEEIRPDVLVDAVMAKRNTGTRRTDAPIVIGVGPGFTAPDDCHCAVETKRGHDLGRVYYTGSPIPNTGVPGEIGGYGLERLIRSSADGIFAVRAEIGDVVSPGQVVAEVDGHPVCAQIGGVLRGLLPAGTPVTEGMKAGDVDPRCERAHCFSVSDKARSVGGGVLEAILHMAAQARQNR